jgi:hypothetical protein
MLPWPVSRAVLPAILAAGAAVACAQPTGLVLHLDVPDDSTLAPDSAATVTIEARPGRRRAHHHHRPARRRELRPR